MGSEDMVLLDPILLAVEEELKAVVSSPGDMAVAVASVCRRPGTACVGLVVVPAEFKGYILCGSPINKSVHVAALLSRCSAPVPADACPKYSLLCSAAWIRSPRGYESGADVGGVSASGFIKLIPETLRFI